MDLTKIDYTDFYAIGAGSKCMVITDGTIVIKLGEILQEDVDTLIELAEHGFAPPVHEYAFSATIPDDIVKLTSVVWSYGKSVSVEDYIDEDEDHFIADVIIMEYAEPLAKHERFTNAYDRLASELESVISNRLGIWLSDCHGYNIGRYNDRYVILDV
jgi:hypothetical protein